MNIMIIGCGRVGSELAYRLFQRGDQVTVVDSIASAFQTLPPDFRGRTVEGEVLNQDVLRRAGIEHASALAAVTNNDAVNAVVAHLACSVYHVPSVVVRNYDPRRRAVLEAFGLQVVSSSSWGAQRIEEMLYQTDTLGRTAIHTVFSAGNGEVEVYEFAVPRAWQGSTVGDLVLEGTCVVVALTRVGRAVLPSRDTRLEVGDVMHVSATLECIEALRERLDRPPVGAPGAASAEHVGAQGNAPVSAPAEPVGAPDNAPVNAPGHAPHQAGED